MFIFLLTRQTPLYLFMPLETTTKLLMLQGGGLDTAEKRIFQMPGTEIFETFSEFLGTCFVAIHVHFCMPYNFIKY